MSGFTAYNGVAVATNVAEQTKTKAVYIGVSTSYDFSFDGTNWVVFKGATAGQTIPIGVMGGRITSGSAALNSGDVIFLY